MTKNKKHAGDIIKLYRNGKGLTLKDMGKELGITYAQYQRYEKGVTPPPFDRLERIINLLGIPPARLFNVERNIDSLEQFDRKIKKYAKILKLLEDDPKLLKMLKAYGGKPKRR